MKILQMILIMFFTMIVVIVGAESQSLKIATWNMQWLHYQSGQGFMPRENNDYHRLRQYAALLNADVIALQEVNGAQAAKRVFSSNQYQFVFSDRRHVQRVGFAIKKSIEIIDKTVLPNLGLGNKRLRNGVMVTISWQGQPIRLLALHLKSGCFTNPLRSSSLRSCQLLDQQLDVLRSLVESYARNNTPFIILGDFNRVYSESDYFWQYLFDGNYLLNIGEGQKSNCWQGVYPDYIDHIILNSAAKHLADENSFEQVLFLKTDHPVYRLSDHCPISIIMSLTE